MGIRQKLQNKIWPTLGATRLCEQQKYPLYRRGQKRQSISNEPLKCIQLANAPRSNPSETWRCFLNDVRTFFEQNPE